MEALRGRCFVGLGFISKCCKKCFGSLRCKFGRTVNLCTILWEKIIY